MVVGVSHSCRGYNQGPHHIQDRLVCEVRAPSVSKSAGSNMSSGADGMTVGYMCMGYDGG